MTIGLFGLRVQISTDIFFVDQKVYIGKRALKTIHEFRYRQNFDVKIGIRLQTGTKSVYNQNKVSTDAMHCVRYRVNCLRKNKCPKELI